MIVLKYVCIARDDQGRSLVSVCTHREPATGVRKRCMAPVFHRFMLSMLAQHPTATSVETRSLEGWEPGADVESLRWVVTASRTEETRAVSPRVLAYSFPDEKDLITC